MILELAYYGEPILRKKAEAIKELTEELRQFVADMIETMDAKDGVGLAAPQVHKSLALFVTRVPVQTNDEKWEPGDVRVFINPKIMNVSAEQESDTEGCLSIPKLYSEVDRPIKITVQAMDLDGNTFMEDFFGLAARVVLHENDHINGVLFIDRLDKKERKNLDPLLREIKKKYYSKK